MLIKAIPDLNVEPGHQVLFLPFGQEGHALAKLLLPEEEWSTIDIDGDGNIRIPHTHEVDKRIIALIDELADVRFSAPGLVQMEMREEA